MQVVFLVGSYYPMYSAVGRCQGNIADEMVTRGYSVTVISQKAYGDLTDNVSVYKGQYIHRIFPEEGNYERNFLSRVKRLARRISSCIIADRNWKAAFLDALEKLDFEPDLIIAACSPFEAVWALADYKSAHPKSKCVGFFYDMFADNSTLYKTNIEKLVKKKTNQEMEREALSKLDVIYCMPSWKKYLMVNFPELVKRCVAVEHPLVLPKYTGEEQGDVDSNSQNTSIKLVFAGALTKNYVEADELIQFLLKSSFKSELDIKFFSIGSGTAVLNKVKEINVTNMGWISYERLIKQLWNADILISIAERKGKQISSKIFEYMCIGKPILHIFFAQEDVNLQYLNKYPLALCLNLGGWKVI